MSNIIFSDNSKEVEIESIVAFVVVEIKPSKMDAFNLPYNVIQVWSSSCESMQYLDKEQLNEFITRLQQMEKLL